MTKYLVRIFTCPMKTGLLEKFFFLLKYESTIFLHIFSASKCCYLVPIFPLVFLYRSHGCSLVVLIIGCGWFSSISQRMSSRVGVTDGYEEGLPGGTNGKEPACQCRRHKRHHFNPWIGKVPWRRKWQPMPVFLLGESQGLRSLVGYSP